MPLVVFKRGSRGPSVIEIQKQLNILAGYALSPMGNGSSECPPLEEDGRYGKRTAFRVEEFQMWNPPLKVDGKVGPNTWNKMMGKFWSPEVAKAAQEAAPVVADQPDDPTEGYLYLLSGTDYVSRRMSGNHLTKPGHNDGHIVRIYVDPGEFPNVGQIMKDRADREDLIIKEMIIAGHSYGAGSISMSGMNTKLEGKVETFFSGVRHRFRANSIVWIYACSFATPNEQVLDSDHDIVWPDEMANGPGLNAMRKLARYLNCTVRAPFGYKDVNSFDGFETFWVEVKADGSRATYSRNIKLSASRELGVLGEHAQAMINKANYWLGGGT